MQKLNYIADLFKGSLKSKDSLSDTSIEKIMLEIDQNKNGVIVIIKDNKNLFSWEKAKSKVDYSQSQEFREYGVGAQILRDLGVRKMILLTNSKKAIIGLEGFDLKIVGHKEINYE